jgi:hypothetical protein
MLAQIDNAQGEDSEVLIFDDHVGIAQDCMVQWLWNAYNAINKPALMKKVMSLHNGTRFILSADTCPRLLSSVFFTVGICCMSA